MVKSQADHPPVRACAHCGNRAPMPNVAHYSQVSTDGDVTDSGYVKFTWEEGYIYDLFECPACEEVTVLRWYYHSEVEPQGSDPEILFPSRGPAPSGLPESISKALQAAERVKRVDANAFGVLLGRVLEMVCIDREANGGSLSRMLSDLAERGEIPPGLVEIADSLRQLRNVGAHAMLGELTAEEVPVLEDLTRAVLEYVYSAPELVERAQRSLQRLGEDSTEPG